jgi:uncharacterized protein (TIGR00661 family)
MGRILFGVMGDAWGHVSQALAVAEALPQHDFLFLGGGQTVSLRQMGRRVVEVPMLRTFYRNRGVDVGRTALNGLKTLFNWRRIVERVSRIASDFQPDLVLTTYEHFSPFAARRLGIPCLSLDNQHAVTKCAYPVPKGEFVSRLLYLLPLRLLYSRADLFLITAFCPLEPLNRADTEVFPPFLRKAALKISPSRGDHLVVYQTSPRTSKRLFLSLLEINRECRVYGLGERPPNMNLVYKGVSTNDLLQDLASCRYLITNGGYNLMAEALYFGKPVLSFPIPLAYEQFFNAHMLESSGYGRYFLQDNLDMDDLRSFEEKLEQYEARIQTGEFCGNDEVASRIEECL